MSLTLAFFAGLMARQVSGEHCLASFWDHYTHLELRLFNTRLSRQLTLSLDDATAARLGLLPPAPDDGGIPTIRDLDLKVKRGPGLHGLMSLRDSDWLVVNSHPANISRHCIPAVGCAYRLT